MQFWKSLLLPIGLLSVLLPGVNAAFAGQNAFRSTSGDTVFPSAAFGCAGDKVSYTTRYHGTAYVGTLWIKSPAGVACEGGRGRVVRGYFEELSDGSGEWCQGQLTLYLLPLPSGSYAQWSNIRPVPGYHCAGSGSTPKLPLRYAAQ